MSLQIWLPLDGTLKNLGCCNAVIENNGASVEANGKIGSCYSFDGVDDYISITDTKMNSIFTGQDNPFSIATWIYHADSTRAIIMGDYGLGGGSFNIELTPAGLFRFYWGGDPDYSVQTMKVGQETWSHITITYDGEYIRGYLNGVLMDTRECVLSRKAKSNGVFRIGADNRTGITVLNGRMNDFRIYDHCLSNAEVTDIAKGLVMHYKLDSIAPDGATIVDTSGYSHHGTIANTVTESEDSPRYACSINLPNGNSCINCGRGGMVTDSITVNMWVNFSSWANPVSCTESGGWNFESNPVRFPVNITSVGYKHATAAEHPSANAWHMLTGVYDRINQKMQIYIDGELSGETDTGSSNPIYYHSTNVIWIGAEATGSATTYGSPGMIGKVSDFRIYCTPLSAEAIKELYQTAMKIDNHGNVMPFELAEGNSTKISSQGIVTNPEFVENGNVAKISQTFMKANEFIER